MHTASSGKPILYACFIFSVRLNKKAIHTADEDLGYIFYYIVRRNRGRGFVVRFLVVVVVVDVQDVDLLPHPLPALDN